MRARDIRDSAPHPVLSGVHGAELNLAVPPGRELGVQCREFGVVDLQPHLGNAGDHEVEAWLLIDSVEDVLGPALNGLHGVIESIEPRSTPFRARVVDLVLCLEFQWAREENLGIRRCLHLNVQVC